MSRIVIITPFAILSIRKNLTKFNIFPDNQNKNPMCKRQADRYNFMNSKENIDLRGKGKKHV